MRIRRIAASALALVFALALAPAGAHHFDGSEGTGSFDPRISASVAVPVEGRASDVTITMTQQDHEDPPRMLAFRLPAGWSLGLDRVRRAENANATYATACTGPLSAPDGAGLRAVARAEILGTMRLVVAADAIAPRTQPVRYEGDLFLLSWTTSPAAGTLCGHLTTQDSRVWNLHETTKDTAAPVDVRQLTFGFPVARLADGRWEVSGDITSTLADPAIQAAQVSILELSSTLLAHTRGNWQSGGAVPGFAVNPDVPFAASGTSSPVQIEAEFHPCHAHTGESQPCGALAVSGASDVTRSADVTLYPQRARPVRTSPVSPAAVFLGTRTATLRWEPHSYSAPAADPVKGLSGWTVLVTSLADRGAVAACPDARALVCRDATNPIVPSESSPGVVSDADGKTTLTVQTPADGWYAYEIVARYRDGSTSSDTDLGSVRGATTGAFYIGTEPWPLAYAFNTEGDFPIVLFVDPVGGSFEWVMPNATFRRQAAAMAPESPTQGTLLHVDPGLNGWTLAIRFETDRATGLWQSGSWLIPFDGRRA